MTDLERVRKTLRVAQDYTSRGPDLWVGDVWLADAADEALVDLDAHLKEDAVRERLAEAVGLRYEWQEAEARYTELLEAVKHQFEFNESSMEPRLRQLIEENDG